LYGSARHANKRSAKPRPRLEGRASARFVVNSEKYAGFFDVRPSLEA
jgi:hypothetical protein